MSKYLLHCSCWLGGNSLWWSVWCSAAPPNGIRASTWSNMVSYTHPNCISMTTNSYKVTAQLAAEQALTRGGFKNQFRISSSSTTPEGVSRSGLVLNSTQVFHATEQFRRAKVQNSFYRPMQIILLNKPTKAILTFKGVGGWFDMTTIIGLRWDPILIIFLHYRRQEKSWLIRSSAALQKLLRQHWGSKLIPHPK